MINNKKVAEAISGEPYLVLDRVELQLPSTIVLNVRERKAAGVVESGGSYALIDYTGVVLRVVNEKPVDLITITGIENENAKQGKTIDGMDEYKSFCLNKLMISLEEYDSLDITAIDISMPVAIMLETKPGIKIKLGLIDNLADSLVLAKNFLPRLISEGKKSGTLDVSGNSASYIP
jgi:cell division septal protein FtsQ